MKYRGVGKHNKEELEQIIEKLQTELIDLLFEINNSKEIELRELLSDILFSAQSINSGEINSETIIKSIIQNINEFNKIHRIKL